MNVIRSQQSQAAVQKLHDNHVIFDDIAAISGAEKVGVMRKEVIIQTFS